LTEAQVSEETTELKASIDGLAEALRSLVVRVENLEATSVASEDRALLNALLGHLGLSSFSLLAEAKRREEALEVRQAKGRIVQEMTKNRMERGQLREKYQWKEDKWAEWEALDAPLKAEEARLEREFNRLEAA
jgi:hypothetical protein